MSRRGLTLIELGVVLLVTALLLPSIDVAARLVLRTPESVRCTAHSVQLGRLCDRLRRELVADDWRLADGELRIGERRWAATERGLACDDALEGPGVVARFETGSDGWLRITLEAPPAAPRVIAVPPTAGVAP